MSKIESKQSREFLFRLLQSARILVIVIFFLSSALSAQTRGWGSNDSGGLGIGNADSPQPNPVTLPNSGNITGISGGLFHTLFLLANDTVTAVGGNQDGQLGDGTSGNARLSPVPVIGLSNVIAVSAGARHSLALKSDGTVWVFGSNANAEVGNGVSGGNQAVPVQNSALTGISQIGAGWHFSVALKPDGTVFAWGFNVRGEMGNGTTNPTGCQCQSAPVQTSISNVVDIKTAGTHTLAKKRDGSLWTWGWNQAGEMGIGVADTTGCLCRATPVQPNVGAGNPVFGIGYNYSFSAVPSANTPAGSTVVLQGDNLSIAFDSVTSAGATSYPAIDPGSTGLNPGGFTVLANSSAYNISTTTAFSGSVKVCVKTPTVFSQTTFNSLAILHGEGATLVNRTFSRNYAAREICAQTNSLSPFVLAQSVRRAPFDFDGDGKTDISIFRPAPAEWWYQRSSDGQVPAVQFGTSSDRLTPGDFTGDGKADIAFYRPSNGFWFILRSEDSSFFSFPFGTLGDLPAPGDYDGDGKFDACVFRPSNATWFINQTTAGLVIVQFGISTDRPVPNTFVP
ncbi:MAG: FG-GAP-like repeat-containing protein [Actinomycetota bacterium]